MDTTPSPQNPITDSATDPAEGPAISGQAFGADSMTSHLDKMAVDPPDSIDSELSSQEPNPTDTFVITAHTFHKGYRPTSVATDSGHTDSTPSDPPPATSEEPTTSESVFVDGLPVDSNSMVFDKGTLVKLDEAVYAESSHRYMAPVHTWPYDTQADVAYFLRSFLDSNRKELSEAIHLKGHLKKEITQLTNQIDDFPRQLRKIEEEHGRKLAPLDLRELNKQKKELKLKESRAKKDLAQFSTELRDAVGNQHRKEVKQRMDEFIATYESSRASSEEEIQALKVRLGLPELYTKMELQKEKLRKREGSTRVQRVKCEADLRILRHNIAILERVGNILAGNVRFAETLAALGGPFKFFRLPRELRDKVYGYLLTFKDKTTIMSIVRGQARFRRHREIVVADDTSGLDGKQVERVKLWIHPLFRTSKYLREEASEYFYRANHFVLPNKAAFDIELCRFILPKNFFCSIRNLSIPLTALGYGTKLFCSRVFRLEGLRNLNIYASWKTIKKENAPDCLAVEAFRSLVIDHCVVPQATSCFIARQNAAFKESLARFKHFRADIVALKLPEYRFAVTMFIFRRRTPELRAQDEAQEVAAIDDLITVARKEIQELEDAKKANQLENSDQEQNGGLSVFPVETEKTKYPITTEILRDERFHTHATHKLPFVFHKLTPLLKINVFDCPMTDERYMPQSKSESALVFRLKALKFKDPAKCEKELCLRDTKTTLRNEDYEDDSDWVSDEDSDGNTEVEVDSEEEDLWMGSGYNRRLANRICIARTVKVEAKLMTREQVERNIVRILAKIDKWKDIL